VHNRYRGLALSGFCSALFAFLASGKLFQAAFDFTMLRAHLVSAPCS
jgi:hypothetical protein